MSIRVVCPNGHELNVKESFAGKTGLCPMCKARVVVPQRQQAGISEDAILRILGSHEAGAGKKSPVAGARPSPSPEAAPTQAAESCPTPAKPPKKACIHCDREIDAATHICPFCHMYIASLKDF